jgi:hypothetical protein
MNLKNYTSSVPVVRTVYRIEELLAAAGAKAIGKNYEEGRLVSLTFQLAINGRDHLIRLPANPTAVYDAMCADVKRPHAGTLDRIKDQSERTAWKIQQDWLEIELTKMKLRQTEPLQAFLAYLWDGEQTFYQKLKEGGFKQLPEKT